MLRINRGGHFLLTEAAKKSASQNQFTEVVILRQLPLKIVYFRRRSSYNNHLCKSINRRRARYKARLGKCGPIGGPFQPGITYRI